MQYLLQYLGTSLQYGVTQIWLILNPNQPLSWKTLLSLCVFSWLMAFVTSDAQWVGALAGNPSETHTTASFLWFHMSFVRWLLFTLGWIFLCLAMAWMLVKATITLPLLGLKIHPAAWVVGLLSSTYVFLLGRGEVRMGAIVAWPALSALYTLLPKVITSTGTVRSPDPKVRQQFVMVLFASTTVSCWLQFCMLMQGWLTEYPVLTLGPLAQSSIITPIGSAPTVAKIAQNTLDQTLQLLSPPEARTWISKAQRYSEAVNDRFQTKLLQQQTLLETLIPTESQDQLSGDIAEDEDGPGASPPLAPTSANPVRETWRLSLMPDPDNRLAVLLQLRSLPPSPTTTSAIEAYIEYFCRVKPYFPQSESRPESSGTTNQPSRPPRVISQPVPSEGDRSAVNPATDNPVNASRPTPDTPSPAPEASDNAENYRQSTITCEFTGFHLDAVTPSR